MVVDSLVQTLHIHLKIQIISPMQLKQFLLSLIPIAMIFALGFYIKRKKLANVIFGVMTFLFVIFCIINIYFETKGNPEIDKMGIAQNIGSNGRKGNKVWFCSYCLLECCYHIHFQWFCEWYA